MTKVAIVGTTTWGTTLAIHLARNGKSSALLARTVAEQKTLLTARENFRFLPGVTFPPDLDVTADPKEAFDQAAVIIIAVPSQSFRSNLRKVRDSITEPHILLSVTKGLEEQTGSRMSQILDQELKDSVASRSCVLSGPNLAKEVLSLQPASAVVAANQKQSATTVQGILTSPTFRVYTNDDVTGVELGGALKNVVAIAFGICEGLNYGDNAKAALLTRGLAEITRLGIAAGAKPSTFAGLAGLGDLIATCSSPLSRNTYVGKELSAGRQLQDILTAMPNVAEGVHATSAAIRMGRDFGVDLPIAESIYRILFQGLDVSQAITELLGRPLRQE